MIADNSFLDEF